MDTKISVTIYSSEQNVCSAPQTSEEIIFVFCSKNKMLSNKLKRQNQILGEKTHFS